MPDNNLVVVDAQGFERIYEKDHLRAKEEANFRGLVVAELWNKNGELRDMLELANLITTVGDQYYGERAAGIAAPPAQVVGMKLGTGVTAPTKTGAAAALVTYKVGSNALIAAGFPTSALSGSSRRIAWKCSWAAGIATDAALAEAVLFNDANADLTSPAGNTIARVLLSPTINKGASDTLEITWNHDLLGS